jgi:hypothetical protein
MESVTLPEENVQVEQEIPALFDYNKSKSRIDKIISDWTGEIEATISRRKERYIDLDVDALRAAGDIEQDAFLIPDRVIDSNIQQETSDSMGFLNSGFRLAIFDCITNPSEDCRDIEIQFTKGLTYDGWYKEFDMCEDAAALHKLGYIEVVFDQSKPLFVGFEYIAFDKLFYNKKVASIQQSEYVIRQYDLSPMTFETWSKKYGFDPAQADLILKDYNDNKKETDVVIYRIYFKYESQVYTAWYSKQGQTSNWLLAPVVRVIGIIDPRTMQQIPLDMYSIFPRLYKPDENEVLLEHYGRGFLDAPTQEANTAILSSLVNNVSRSANYYASPTGEDDSSAEMKQLEFQLTPGAITNKPLQFWSLPQPNPETPNIITFLDNRNAASRGKSAFTVMNLKDSRKTAKEMDIAETNEQKVTGKNLANFSGFLRSIFIFSWRIVQSQALLDTIPFLRISTPNPATGELIWQNDKRRIAQQYDIRPAGDTDIVQAAAETQKMREDWPVFSNPPVNPFALKFFEDYIKLRYPQKATEYIAVLRQGNPAKQLIAGLSQIVKGAIQNPQELATLPPQDIQQTQGLVQQAEMFLQQP